MTTKKQLNNIYYFVGLMAIPLPVIIFLSLLLGLYDISFLNYMFLILCILSILVAGIELNQLLEKIILFFKKPIFLIILILGIPLYFYFLEMCADYYILDSLGSDVLDFPTAPKKIIISMFTTLIFTSLTCLFLFYKALFHLLISINLRLFINFIKIETQQKKKKLIKIGFKHWYIKNKVLFFSTLMPRKFKTRTISTKNEVYITGKIFSQITLISVLILISISQFKILESKTSKYLFIGLTFTKNNSCNNKDTYKSHPYNGYVLEYDDSSSTIRKISCPKYKVLPNNYFSLTSLLINFFKLLPWGGVLIPKLYK